MPKNPDCWASWVYLSEQKNDNAAEIGVTYWMNLLQNIDNKYPLFVTLNPANPPAPELVFNKHIFHHPVFTVEAIAAQEQLEKIQGVRNTWFCGAYQRYGFHEDGMMSGVNVAQKLGAKLPW
jgi:predicted NAD/FAD-binding protein